MKQPLCLAVCVLLAACQSEQRVGQDAANVASDTDVLREASAAVNEVVRAAGDCEGVKAGLDQARQSLNDAEARVATATGKTTLDALRKRLEGIAETCP
jgi:hypothetical protein